MPPVDVVLEEGRRRTFACALDWPGWARSGPDAEAALGTLEVYRARYGAVLSAERIATPTGGLRVVERIAGGTTTDFGAPGAVAQADHRAYSRAARSRAAGVLAAAWSALDAAVATRPTLRRGPRGGGRDAEALWRHVADAEVAYARGMGLSVRATNGDPSAVTALRGRLVGLVLGEVEPDREARWPLRYGARRVAWHVLDHLFELEDRRAG